jgi:hypothetical protein
MRTFDVYYYTKESRIIRVKAISEKKALKFVEDMVEDAGRLIDHNIEVDELKAVEIKEDKPQ